MNIAAGLEVELRFIYYPSAQQHTKPNINQQARGMRFPLPPTTEVAERNNKISLLHMCGRKFQVFLFFFGGNSHTSVLDRRNYQLTTSPFGCIIVSPNVGAANTCITERILIF
jgi:hypothetical protein